MRWQPSGLTLLAAGIAVPLNLRVRRGGGVGHRQVRFRRQETF